MANNPFDPQLIQIRKTLNRGGIGTVNHGYGSLKTPPVKTRPAPPGEMGVGASALADLTDVDLETDPPEVGETITWDGEFWVPGGGGGGGGSSPLSIDTLTDFNAVFGSTYVGHDQEFNATSTSLPSGWSWFNQGTSTYQERFGAGTVIGQGSGFRGIVQSVTGLPTTFDLYTKLAASPLAAAMEWGPFLTDGTALRIFNRAQSAVGTGEYDRARLATWSDATTFVSVTSDTSVQLQRRPTYLRVRRNSTTSFDFHVSTDGRAWATIFSTVNPSITPTHIGLCANGGQVSCEWWRIR